MICPQCGEWTNRPGPVCAHCGASFPVQGTDATARPNEGEPRQSEVGP
jgi:hypothetical protein